MKLVGMGSGISGLDSDVPYGGAPEIVCHAPTGWASPNKPVGLGELVVFTRNGETAQV